MDSAGAAGEGLIAIGLRTLRRSVVLLNGALCALFMAIGLIVSDDPGKMFGEGKPGTLLSVLMLALASFGSLRRAWSGLPGRLRVGWAIFGFTLGLAALDDMFKWHESVDEWIIRRRGLNPHGLADKLDDVLVLLYAVPALVAMLWAWRRYVLTMPAMLWRLGAATLLFGIMVVLDIVDRLLWAEESAKVMSASLIFAAIVGTPLGPERSDDGPPPGDAPP